MGKCKSWIRDKYEWLKTFNSLPVVRIHASELKLEVGGEDLSLDENGELEVISEIIYVRGRVECRVFIETINVSCDLFDGLDEEYHKFIEYQGDKYLGIIPPNLEEKIVFRSKRKNND